MNFLEFQDKFGVEEQVMQHFIKIRYESGNVICNRCKSTKVYRRKDHRPKFFQCADCKADFSIFKDTMFEDTYTDLRKWMYAIHLFLNGKKGISALQLQREIKVTYKTSWRMLHKIRSAMGNKEKDFNDFRAILEMDETYVGGKPRRGATIEPLKRGRGTKKIPVVGVVCRTSKQVHARVTKPDKFGRKLTGKQLLSVLDEVINRRVIVMTDEFTGYNIFAHTNHAHFQIDHTKLYAKGAVHTNTIESFWATLKRGIYGIYHQISPKYLQQYVNEFCFRYNNRKEVNAFDTLLMQGIFS